MDIEGAEDEVLHPGAAWLQRTGELNIELHAPATYEKCYDLLTKAGFDCERSARHKNSILAKRHERPRKHAVASPA
jgi:hypothetical protein